MSRQNRKYFLTLIGLLASHIAYAMDIKLAPIGSSALKDTTPLVTPMMVAMPPKISGLVSSGGCVSKGGSVVVQGANFGTQSGKGIALGGSGIHVDLVATSWSSTGISVTIPNVPQIQNGQWYYLGIEKSDHAQWLSNIDKTITICSASTTTLNPLTVGGRVSTGKSTDPTKGGDSTEPAGEPAPSGFGTAPPSGPMPPTSGGSLLSAQLPPPPKDLPPAPPKESQAIEPAELVVVSANMSDAQQLASQAQGLGLAIKRRSNLSGLGFVVTVFRVPKQTSVGDALLALRQTIPNAWADANHRYQLMGDDTKTYGQRLIGWSNTSNCGSGIRIGLIDTAIDVNHPQLRGHKIQTNDFIPNGGAAAIADHGTATSALLVGRDMGLVPGATVFAANIFRTRDKETDTTAEWVVQALNWLAENRVSVINLSLGGPRNLMIEAAVQRLLDNHVAIVAAAGNGGDSAPPVFPAAQPGVVAVTAVDANLDPYKRANRGDYITFAAPGVDVWTAAPERDGVFVSGTSYAVPYVTAALASARQSNGKMPWPAIVKQLQSKARDLGAPGKDPTFGWGLVQSSGCRLSAASK